MRGWGRLVFVCLAFLFGPAIACLAEDSDTKLIPTEAETLFLDRLMRAESAGRQFAKNRASSALGPFQFLGTTFLDVVRRNFPVLASGKTDADILALRTDFQVSRDVALIYTRENAGALTAKGKETTAANLRLAFFAGVNGALRVLEAEPDALVSNLLSQAAIAANPFLRSMTASQLLARASREAEGQGDAAVATGALPKPSGASAKVAVRCNLGLASCRHWLALAEKRVAVSARLVSSGPKAKAAGR
jgi:hypothetical protein